MPNQQEPTPAQRLWAEVFGRSVEEAPRLDKEKVLEIVDSLFDSRERIVVRLRFGLEGYPQTMDEIGSRLPRADGGVGVYRQEVQGILQRALEHLRHRDRRRSWEEAIR